LAQSPEDFSESRRRYANSQNIPAAVTLYEVDVFRQRKFCFGGDERPDPVCGDMIPMSVRHLLVHSNRLKDYTSTPRITTGFQRRTSLRSLTPRWNLTGWNLE
jgi:hypothetical protein